MSDNDNRKETAETLRRDLDSGRGRDKLAAPDPAAAPLGTDDEAAGTPISPEQARLARSEEIRGAGAIPDVPPPMTAAARPDEPTSGNASAYSGNQVRAVPEHIGWIASLAVGVCVVGVILWMLAHLFD